MKKKKKIEVIFRRKDLIQTAVILIGMCFLANLTLDADFSFLVKQEWVEGNLPVYSIFVLFVWWGIKEIIEFALIFGSGIFVGKKLALRKKK